MISIVIPVYNASQSLDQCVESILGQTYCDWELILVDDGSSDGSSEICDKYASRDSRVIVVHQENGGVSDARNRGIDEAQGEYLMFIDSDDWVEPTYVEALYRSITTSESDMAICGVVLEPSGKKRVASHDDEFLVSDKTISKFIEVERGLPVNSPWSKVYRTKIVKDNSICFPVGVSRGEDLVFNYSYLENVSKISIISLALYHYLVNDSGLSSKKCRERFAIDYEQWSMIKSFHDKRGMSSVVVSDFLNYLLWEIICDSIYLVLTFEKEWSRHEKINFLCEVMSTPEISEEAFRKHRFKASWVARFSVIHRLPRLFYFAMWLRGKIK